MPTAMTEGDLLDNESSATTSTPDGLGCVDEVQQHHHNSTGCAIMDSGEECDEPASKKLRTTSSLSASQRERNKYKGMRIRQCLCGFPDCLPRLKGWIDLNDSKRQGFKELPRQSSKSTPVGMEKNRVRDIMFLHIKGHRSPKYDENDKTNRERKLFVAFHHFHPAILQSGNKGPYQYISLELAERIGGFAECDTVQNLPGLVFHPIPNYPREQAEIDFEIAGGIAQPRNVRTLWPSSSSLSSSSQRAVTAPAPKPSKKPDACTMRSRVRDVLGQMERDPLKVANNYLKMQERLKQYDEMMEMEQQHQLPQMQQQHQHQHNHNQHIEIEVEVGNMESDHDTFTGAVVDV